MEINFIHKVCNSLKRPEIKISKEHKKKILDSDSYLDYFNEIVKSDWWFWEYRDEIANLWREIYINPFKNFKFERGAKYPIYSSNPLNFDNNVSLIYPEYNELSLQEKLVKIYGKEYSDLYFEMLGNPLNEFREKIYIKFKPSKPLKQLQKWISWKIEDLRLENWNEDYTNTGNTNSIFIVDKEWAIVMPLNDYYVGITYEEAENKLEELKQWKILIPKIKPNLSIPEQMLFPEKIAKKVKETNITVYRTENAKDDYKWLSIFGEWKYFSLRREDCERIAQNPKTEVYEVKLPKWLKLLEIEVDNDWYLNWQKSLIWRNSFKKSIVDKGFDWAIIKVHNDPDFNLAWDQVVIYNYKYVWENDLIQQAKKYKTAEEFISSEPEIEVNIDDLIPTEWHTYDNTIGKHWWPREEFANKPPYVLLKKNWKFQIVDWNHRYFLAKEEDESIMKVKLENFFPVSNEEKTHLNILKEIWEQAHK